MTLVVSSLPCPGRGVPFQVTSNFEFLVSLKPDPMTKHARTMTGDLRQAPGRAIMSGVLVGVDGWVGAWVGGWVDVPGAPGPQHRSLRDHPPKNLTTCKL